ncbi:hypothetical protein [Lactococcus garvieae]
MATFEEAMKLLIDEAEALSIGMSVEDKKEVTKAGAKVFQKALEAQVVRKHYRYRKTGENPHLSEGIKVKNTNIDNVADGQSIVGWERSTKTGTNTKGYIANIINNGSRIPQFTTRSGRKYKNPGAVAINADHFIEETRENPIVQEMILTAESEALRRIINRRNKNKK